MSDTAKAPTVEDIAWRINTEFGENDIFAEDQFIVFGGQHAKRIVEDHNRLLEIEAKLDTAILALKDIFDSGEDRPASWAFYVTRAEIALARIGALGARP